MDQSEAPLLDALIDYHHNNRYGFTPPGHRQGRGADDRCWRCWGSRSATTCSPVAGLDPSRMRTAAPTVFVDSPALTRR